MQNNNKKSFLTRSSYVDFVLWIGEFAGSKFLALTTSVLAFSLVDQFVLQNVAEQYIWIGRMVGVLFFYILIDFGLTAMIRWYWNEKAELKTDAAARQNPMRRLFLTIICGLIILRFIATMTSSIWAAPEVAIKTTGDFNYEYFINQLTTADSIQAARENSAQNYAENLTASEKRRIERKAQEATAHIESAIASGDYWQRDSYSREGFSWLENRKNSDAKDKQYAARIRKAQKEAAKMIADEKSRTQKATASVDAIRADSSHAKIVSGITTLSQAAQESHELRVENRRGLVIFFDILAGTMVLICSWLRTLRRRAADEDEVPEEEKDIATIFQSAWSKWKANQLANLEILLGLDIDGDGTIGQKQELKSLSAPDQNIGFLAIKNRTSETTGNSEEKQPETVLRNNAKQSEKQRETAAQETTKQLVPQRSQRETATPETVLRNNEKQSQKQSEKIRETVIVSAPETDVSKWRKYAVTYYKRSIKETSSEETRERNRQEYNHYADLLRATEKFELIEKEDKLIIKEIG